MQNGTFEMVVNEIAEVMDIPASTLRADSQLAAIGMDSLEALQLLVALEESLKVELEESDLKRFATVQSIVDAIEARREKAAAA